MVEIHALGCMHDPMCGLQSFSTNTVIIYLYIYIYMPTSPSWLYRKSPCICRSQQNKMFWQGCLMVENEANSELDDFIIKLKETLEL